MNPSTPHYSTGDLVAAFERVGVATGEVLFVHVSLGRLGYSDRGRTMLASCEALYDALRQAAGPGGTILVPTYTYSIGRRELFDVANTPSTTGEFSEFFRHQPGAIRSADPMLSVAGIGPLAERLLRNLPQTCYGPGSVYDRLHDINARIVVVGLGLYWATYRHYVEEYCRVPFRFTKLFTGRIREKERERTETWAYCAAPFTANCGPSGTLLEKMARDAGICRSAQVGRGEVCAIGCRDYRAFAERAFAKNPWISAAGPPLTVNDLVAKENARVGGSKPCAVIRQCATMMEMLEGLAPLRRDMVSDGYDAGIEALARVVPMTIHEFPTGTECFTWLVPEKWTCKEAWLETTEGVRVFSYQDNPLHAVSYSLPFEGVISREVLFEHLHVHPRLAEAVPFVSRPYERDWGLCCSRSMRESLVDAEYRVGIRADFSYSTLKVGEVVVAGQTSECILLCANLDNAAQVNDGISGVVVGIEVMRRLKLLRNRRYTYRLLVVPRHVGPAAWLSRNEQLIHELSGGLFLTMLARGNPFTLHQTLQGTTELDLCFRLAVLHSESGGTVIPYGPLYDEGHFNAPGVRVPMAALSRSLPQGDADWPYREYHTHLDNLAMVDASHLEEACHVTMSMLEHLEINAVPEPMFRGGVFFPRYGLAGDNEEGTVDLVAVHSVASRMDGVRSLAAIATELSMSLPRVRSIADAFVAKGLCRLHDARIRNGETSGVYGGAPGRNPMHRADCHASQA